MRRTAPSVLGALAAAGALVAGLVTTAPAAQAETTVTMQTKEIDVTVGPAGEQKVCTVLFDLYRPSTATPRTPKPAILTTNGFGGSKDDQADLGQAFAKKGYVVLSYSGLGFGGSDCKITLDDPDWDGRAAKQLVTYLGGGKRANDGTRISYVRKDPVSHDGRARQHDPRVGMVGGSYGGQVQFAVAGIDPRVDTIVPIITWNDLAYSLAPNNTDFVDPSGGVTYRTPGTEKVGWTSLFFGAGIADGIQHAQTDPSRNVGCPNFADQACVAKAQMDALGYPTQDTLDFARHASVSTYVEKIRIPTLLVQGQNDTLFNLQEAVATYRALRAQGTPTKMIWQSWGHSGGGEPAPGELDMADPGSSYEGRRIARWFAKHLKDRDVSTGPRFAYFRDWVDYTGIATPAYGTAAAYPVGTTQRLFLSGADALVADRAAVTAGQRELRQRRGRDADQLLRGRGPAGVRRPGRRHAAVRHPGHLRLVDDAPAGERGRLGRRADAAAATVVAGRRADPGRRTGRSAAAVRQDLRHRARRFEDPGAPARLAHPGAGRPGARHHRAAGCGAPLRGRPPARGGRRGHRRGLSQQQGGAAGDGAHLARRPRRPDPAGARRRTLT